MRTLSSEKVVAKAKILIRVNEKSFIIKATVLHSKEFQKIRFPLTFCCFGDKVSNLSSDIQTRISPMAAQ